jgi:hypothetical protein
MAQNERSRARDDQLLRAFEEAALNDYPNPDRVGCPGADVLKGLASKKLPLRHPARQHVARCSPCFRELKAYQRSARRARLLIAAGALIVISLAGGGSLWHMFHATRSPLAARLGKVDYQDEALDLWDQSGTRGEVGPIGAERRKLQLRRGKLRLRIRLPFGSGDGPYELQIGKSEDQALRETNGQASIENGATFLQASIDTSTLAPGDYFLGVRKPDRTWRHYPIEIK